MHRTQDIYLKVHFYDCKMLLWFNYNLLITCHATGSKTADGMREKPRTWGCRNVLSPDSSLIQTRASGGHSWPPAVFWNFSLPLASRTLCFPGFLLILQWHCPLLLWFFLPRHLQIFELLRIHCSPAPSLCACLWGDSPMPWFSISAVSLGPQLIWLWTSDPCIQLPISVATWKTYQHLKLHASFAHFYYLSITNVDSFWSSEVDGGSRFLPERSYHVACCNASETQTQFCLKWEHCEQQVTKGFPTCAWWSPNDLLFF